jgi:hypothetical protein
MLCGGVMLVLCYVVLCWCCAMWWGCDGVMLCGVVLYAVAYILCILYEREFGEGVVRYPVPKRLLN